MQAKKSKSKTVATKSELAIKKTKTKKSIATQEKTSGSNKKIASPLSEVKNPARGKKEQVFRYSDEELNEFRELINERLEVAKQELLFMQGQMSSDPRLSL